VWDDAGQASDLSASEGVPGEARGTIRALLERGSEFRAAFQPIVSLRDSRLLGFEALLRLPGDAGFSGPGAAFDAAAGTPLLIHLEIAALETHVHAAKGLPDGRLFLNLSARVDYRRHVEVAADVKQQARKRTRPAVFVNARALTAAKPN
jgi:EAL domain-containing protein (putative c-di-GMP-specific phosphodiesterase class I)